MIAPAIILMSRLALETTLGFLKSHKSRINQLIPLTDAAFRAAVSAKYDSMCSYDECTEYFQKYEKLDLEKRCLRSLISDNDTDNLIIYLGDSRIEQLMKKHKTDSILQALLFEKVQLHPSWEFTEQEIDYLIDKISTAEGLRLTALRYCQSTC